MRGVLGLLLGVSPAAGRSGIDPAALFPADPMVYVRQKHPNLSCFLENSFAKESAGRPAVEEFYEVLEIAAAWELDIPPEEMKGLRGGIVLHQATFFPGGDSPYEAVFDLAIEGLPDDRLPRSERSAPRTFYGEAAYAVHGDLVLASSDRGRLEAMLRRARGEEPSRSLLDDPAFQRARRALGAQEEFFYLPVVSWGEMFASKFVPPPGADPATVEKNVRAVRRILDLLGGGLGTFVDDAARPGKKRTDFRFLLDPSHPLFPVYEAVRQEPKEPRLPDRVPGDATFAVGWRLDAVSLLQRVGDFRPPEGGGDDPALSIARSFGKGLGSLLSDPEVAGKLGWLASVLDGEAVFFTNQALPALVAGRADRRGVGFALGLSSPDLFDSIPANLPGLGIPVEEVEGGLFTARIPGLPPVFFARDGAAVVGGAAPDMVRRMREARSSKSSLSTEPLFHDLIPPGRARSKWLYLRIESLLGLLRLSVPGIASLSKRTDRLAIGFETVEESGTLRFWLGVSPLSYFELFTTDAFLGDRLAARTQGLRPAEEKALASLLALREAEEEFRGRGIRDRDGDGLPEYGTLADLAAASLLPKGLSLAEGTGEAQAMGYLFRADVPPETNLAERLWEGYAWPLQYGSTGVNAFWIRPAGLPRRRVDASCAGPGKGPRPDTALVGPMAAEAAFVDDYLWTPVGK
ncbi:MAG: hypothetical protein L0323_16625 [Planctomycetes bacterium]|nr:hypothetical protein [Planctomycetota bacterium]